MQPALEFAHPVLAALKLFVIDLKKYAPPGAAAFDSTERAREIAAKRGAMASVWPATITDIVENPAVSKVVGKMAYAPIPAGPAPEGKHTPMMGNWILSIPITSPHKYWAYKFIEWATDPVIQKFYALAGGVPFRRSILEDPELSKRYPYFTAEARSLAATPFWRDRTPEWFAIEEIFGAYVNSALVGEISPEEALKRASAEIEEYMREVGYY